MQVGSRNVAFRLVLFTIPASFWMGSTNFSLHCCYWRLWAWSCTKPFVKADWFGSCLFGLFGSCINYAISGIFHLENRRENHVKSTQHVRWKVHYVYFVVVKLNMIEASHSYRYMCIYIYTYIYICDESLWKAFFENVMAPFKNPRTLKSFLLRISDKKWMELDGTV